MNLPKRTKALVALVVLITTLLPILASIELSRRQSLETEQRRVADIAQQAGVLSDRLAAQLFETADLLNAVPESQRCDENDITRMSAAHLAAPLVVGIGRIQDLTVRCSSIAGLAGIRLAPPDVVLRTGRPAWTNLSLIDPDVAHLAFQDRDIVLLVDKDSVLTHVYRGQPIGVATVEKQTRRVLLQRGDIAIGPIPPDLERSQTYLRDGNIVAVAPSKRYDVAAIVVSPISKDIFFTSDALKVMLPLAILIGAALSISFVRLMRERETLASQILGGLRRDEFHLVFQPVIDLRSGRMTGVEALLRWHRGKDEDIGPDRFIPSAQEAGLIGRLTDKVLELAVREAPGLLRLDPRLRLSINLSVDDLSASTCADRIADFLRASGFPGEQLVIEVTESSFLEPEIANAIFAGLRQMGVRIAIDDFGTGYSNLTYLADLEIDILMIDQVFIQSLDTQSATSQVARKIFETASQLNLIIVAEGVETERQAEILRELGVGFAQGYYFSPPLRVGELETYLREAVGS